MPAMPPERSHTIAASAAAVGVAFPPASVPQALRAAKINKSISASIKRIENTPSQV
jgi:TRAP-type C4-dicarboxylate transport system permease large subunit